MNAWEVVRWWDDECIPAGVIGGPLTHEEALKEVEWYDRCYGEGYAFAIPLPWIGE